MISRAILWMAKLFCLVVCFYIMYHAKDYRVSWNLFLMVTPNAWIALINAVLSKIGAYILIIPAGILLTSLLTDEYRIINGVAALCGVMGTLTVLVRGVILGRFNEYLNLTFLVYTIQ